jgi:methionine synthase II (cobalamin-independent)
LEELDKKGISRDLMLDRIIFTPACGLGPMSQKDARRALELTSSLAKRI